MAESLTSCFGFVHAQQNASYLTIESNGHVRHGLDATCDHDLALTRHDLSDAVRDRLIGRDARLRDRVSRYLIGESGCQRCLITRVIKC